MKWFDRFPDWWERQPSGVGWLLFPVLAPLMLAYSTILLTVILLFVLPYVLISGRKRVAESPWAKLTLAQVREEAEALDRWFANALAELPDGLGVGPELARQFAHLVNQAVVMPEEAEQFAARVGQQLKGAKGTPFFALQDLSRRFAELTNNQRAA
jgi:hypothetical protein